MQENTNLLISSINVGDSTMDYCRYGVGSRRLVVIPGVSIKSVAADGELLAGIMKDYLDAFTVYVFDRKKLKNKKTYSIEEMASDTVEALNRLGITKASFYGASQGGMIIQVIAEEWPELVEKAVLASTSSRNNEKLTEAVECWASLARAGEKKSLAESFADRVFGAGTLETLRDAIIQPNLGATEEELEQFAIVCSACLEYDRYEALSRFKAPVMLVASRGDGVLTGEASEDIADRLKQLRGNASSVVLKMYGPEYGHGVYAEAPDFFEIMRSFLD